MTTVLLIDGRGPWRMESASGVVIRFKLFNLLTERMQRNLIAAGLVPGDSGLAKNHPHWPRASGLLVWQLPRADVT